jgi:hypothetical protein
MEGIDLLDDIDDIDQYLNNANDIQIDNLGISSSLIAFIVGAKNAPN